MTFSGILLDLKDGLDFDICEKRLITASRLKECCTVISTRLKESRELKKNQEYGLSHFKSLGGENWKESKYVYAISGLQASIYQLKDYIEEALKLIIGFCRCIAALEGASSTFAESKTIDISYQENMLTLNNDESHLIDGVVESRFIKQRTDLWFLLRNKALVTGSTIHSALGLRGRKEQLKHINKIIDQGQSEMNKDLQARLKYGTDNEIHAIATLCSVVLPAYFPSCHYVEEGCYARPGEKRDVCLVVSPDGSVREIKQVDNQISEVSNAVAAIEVKCPFPKENTVPVHYSLPEYYACQCLAEMVVLKTNKLIYLCYSKESSTVFEVTFDENLWQMIWSYLCEIYDGEKASIPKKGGQRVREIKTGIKDFVKANVKFIVEVPSVTAIDSEVSQAFATFPFNHSFPTLGRNDISLSIVRQELIRLLNKAEKSTETCYNLMRRKATEVMVWVLTNSNRDSSLELPCSLPIAYGLKDYKLTSAAMRKATNYVLEKCNEKGIRVCSFSTDGQWINLMNRASNGKPLTLLQLQKDTWSKVQKISKTDLVKLISGLNVVNYQGTPIEEKIDVQRLNQTGISVKSTERCFASIKTSRDPHLWVTGKKKHTPESVSTIESNESNVEITEWMPDEVIQALQNSDDMDLQQAVKTINNTLYRNDTEGRDEINTDNVEDILEEGRIMPEKEIDEPNIDDIDQNQDNIQVENTAEFQLDNIEVGSYDIGNEATYETSNTNTSSLSEAVDPSSPHSNSNIILNEDTLNKMLDQLKQDSKFECYDSQYLFDLLKSKEKLTDLTHAQLNRLYEALHSVQSTVPVLRKSWNKEKKVDCIICIVNNEIYTTTKRVKPKSPARLAKMCEKVINSRKIPKAILNAAYASYIYGTELKTWKENASLKPETVLFGHEEEIAFWYSYPENSTANQYLLGNSIDCSHNLTHLRVRSCTTGIGNVTPNAWKAVAASNETHLNIAFVEDLLDKQSVPNARTNFSEEVESWMARHGYDDAAKVTHIIREWYEASDSPEISVDLRINKLIQMRNFLLTDVNFNLFPPPGRYINKIPIVTFEGLLIDIDTKLQLHGFCGPYNIRSVGSLAAETMVGILQEMNPTQSVSIKARDVPTLISTVVEVMTCKINPRR